MNQNSFYKLDIKKIIVIALFFLVLPMACDSGSDNNNGGGNGESNEPFVSACDRFGVTIMGTEGNDNLIGTEGNDVIRGLGGNDTIDGRGGNDRICGDRGNDNILGGSGIDTIDGGPGDDIVDGQLGNDIILEAPGSHDVLIGPAFNPQGPQTLDEVSFTNALRGIFLDITSNQTQVVDANNNTVRLDGFFPNMYGSFHPDSFFFSNANHNGAVGHVFDPRTGGSDVFIIDAAAQLARVIPEVSVFQGVLGPLQGDTTILIGNTLLNTVDIEKVIVHNFPPRIIDDGDAGYNAPGFTNQAIGGQGFKGDIDFSPAGEGNTASWTFSDLPNGPYHVSTTWDAAPDRATNSPFAMVDGGEPVTVFVDQELAPNEFQDQGESWKTLGNINVTSNQLTVTLSDDADQFVIADAIRIEPLKIGAGDQQLLFVDNVFRNGVNLEFTPVVVPNEVPGGFFGTQLEVPSNVATTINYGEAFLSDLESSMILRATNAFVVSTTYAPNPTLSKQVKITLTFNGVEFETTIDQTQIIPSFTTAPNGQTIFQNLFLCIVTEPSLTTPEIFELNTQFEPITDTTAYDTISITPVNKLEAPILGLSDADFDGDQTCTVLN